MGWLVLNHDGTDLVVHKLLGEVITIGRVPLNHVVIDNPTVSAQHAILARLGDSYRLKDLHSTNGTSVGRCICSPIPLTGPASVPSRCVRGPCCSANKPI
jgi:pSer/pThr/pTyr-binding forkhead associated (FHA) protein